MPPTVALLPRLRTLNLSQNSNIRSPPPAIAESQNTEAIIEHLAETAFSTTKPSFESTLVFVGLEGSGKSSVLQRIKVRSPFDLVFVTIIN